MRTAISTYSTTTVDECFTRYLVGYSPNTFLYGTYLKIGLIKAVRAVAFSPATSLLAAAGDSRIIALYDVSSGEQVANLSGHVSWVMSLDFSSTGEWLLSGYVCLFNLYTICFLYLTIFDLNYEQR
jgi:WD40 repeat protein